MANICNKVELRVHLTFSFTKFKAYNCSFCTTPVASFSYSENLKCKVQFMHPNNPPLVRPTIANPGIFLPARTILA